MLEIPENIKALFRSDNISQLTEKKFKLTFYNDSVETLYPYETLFPDENLFPSEHGEAWLTIENDRIESESLSITESLSESEEMEFGSCNSSMIEIVVADVIEDLTDREFVLTVEIGGYEMTMGIYTVISFVRQADRRKRKITAYDRMRWFDMDVSTWYNELKFPMTLKAFRDSLCAYVGIQQSDTGLIFDSLLLEKTIEPEQISGLDVLKSICQINGRFGHVDKTGQLIYVGLQTTGLYPAEDLFPSEDLYPSEFGGDGASVEYLDTYRELVYEDYLVEGISGLIIRQQEGDIGANVGDGDNVYTVEGNFLVYGKNASELLEIAEMLLPTISGKTYRPSTLDCNGMPWLEVGDALRIITRDDVVETFVMQRITSGCQAMHDNISSTGTPRREEVFGINKQIIQIEGKAAVITKNVEEVSVRITDLKNYTESQFKVTSDAIEAEVKRAQEAESALKITADAITLDVSNFKKDTNARFEVTDEAIRTKVTKGTVSSEISQEAGKITLSANRLIVDSTNFKLDGNGNATFSGNITGGTINIGNVFKVDSGGNTSITGNHFTWDATNSSMKSDGTIICKNLSATNVNLSGTFNATSGKIAGFTISGNSLVADSDNSEIRGGNIVTPSLMVGYTNNVIFSAVGDGNGEIIVRTNIDMTNHSFKNLGDLGIRDLTLETITVDTLNADSIQMPSIDIGNGTIDANTVMAYNMRANDIELDKLGSSQGSAWKSVSKNIDWLVDEVEGLSDKRVKNNVCQIDSKEALTFLQKSNPVTFQYTYDGRWSSGFIAQEVDALQDDLEIYYPLVMTDEKTGYYRIKYTNYIPIIIAAIQNLQEQIAELKGSL